MDDLERRLRAAVTQRADHLRPAADLPQRIHARVARRRRRHRLGTGGLAVVVVAAAVAGGLLARPAGPDTDTAGSGRRAATTRTVRPPAEPAGPTGDRDPRGPGSGSAGGTGTTEPAEPPTTPPTTREPAGTPPPSPATTPTTAGDEPEGPGRAAGACAPTSGAVVVVTLYPDVPAPRCAEVRPDQSLRVENATDEAVDVSLAHHAATVGPGGAQSFAEPFGDYLGPGSHRITTSLYGGTGPELYLVP